MKKLFLLIGLAICISCLLRSKTSVKFQPSLHEIKTMSVIPTNMQTKNIKLFQVQKETSQLKPPQSGTEIRIKKITNLMHIVLPTAEKLRALRPLLEDPRLASDIHSALNDPESYSGPKFTTKLRLLDALYEGLIFPDRQIRKQYRALIGTILSETPPESYPQTVELVRQFRADRVEIALTILKVLPHQARNLRRLPNAGPIFEQANQFKNDYEVAL